MSQRVDLTATERSVMLLTDAGGVNPAGLAQALRGLAEGIGLRSLYLATRR